MPYSFARNGLPVRIAMSALLLAGVGFFAAMAVLVAHDSELQCIAGGTCVHAEHYPLGIERLEPLAKVTVAETMWDPGGRAVALKLVLRHADGTKTEYQGVGKNGDRAEETARELNAFLAQPIGAKTFPLREGSIPVAIFLGLVGLGALFVLPYFFTRVRVAREGNIITVVTGRWPARRQTIELPAGSIRFGAQQVIRNGEPFFSLCAERTDTGSVVELGMVSRFESVAMARVEALQGWLASVSEDRT